MEHIIEYIVYIGIAAITLILLYLLIKPLFISENTWRSMSVGGAFGSIVLWWVEGAILLGISLLLSFAACWTYMSSPRCGGFEEVFFGLLVYSGPALAFLNTIGLFIARNRKI